MALHCLHRWQTVSKCMVGPETWELRGSDFLGSRSRWWHNQVTVDSGAEHGAPHNIVNWIRNITDVHEVSRTRSKDAVECHQRDLVCDSLSHRQLVECATKDWSDVLSSTAAFNNACRRRTTATAAVQSGVTVVV